ncbi:MAG: hypothetical protein A3G87_01905 [Omnitrophica bacterium RIFCSPLOWO2_12_FULL_50_11]|nr:MAG: hypothetical protein A3G87_01905 [Omnitrophica bacterium RIFCSPLOWO2_12_FULL_50_11]
MIKARQLGNSKAAALVETAVILPIFVLLMVGMVEFSRVLMVKQVITNAAREGARAGAVNLDDTEALTAAQNVSENYITISGVESGPATVTSSLIAAGGNPAVQVVIDYDYDSVLTNFIPGIDGTLTLRSTAIMRRES